MRTITRTMVLAIIASVAYADPMVQGTIYDGTFPGSSCTSGCDVIGDRSSFDIEKIELFLGPHTSTVNIFTNYGTTPPNQWSYNATGAHPPRLDLNLGDLFFTFGGTFAYGIVLAADGHGGFLQDRLYEVGDGVTTQTASQVLGIHSYPQSSWIFRDNAVVWLGGTPSTPLAQGTHTVTNRGTGSDPRWIVSVTFPSAAVWDDAVAHGRVGVSFASATCGNDIITGEIAVVVPEPATGALLLGGGLMVWGYRRLARARRKS